MVSAQTSVKKPLTTRETYSQKKKRVFGIYRNLEEEDDDEEEEEDIGRR
jgi:hypothetical protein